MKFLREKKLTREGRPAKLETLKAHWTRFWMIWRTKLKKLAQIRLWESWTGMISPVLTWQEASLIVAKAAGHGVRHARNLCTWIHAYLKRAKLPVHCYGWFCSSILDDEDLAMAIQLHLQELMKDNYI